MDYQIGIDQAYTRLDQFITLVFDSVSRSQVKKLISKNQVTVNGKSCKPAYKLQVSDWVHVDISDAFGNLSIQPECVEFGVIHEDTEILVVDKPANLITHPAPGVSSGTLVNGLLKRYGNRIRTLDRNGIVHRLDKNTTGVMVVAKTTSAAQHLSGQFKEHTTSRKYIALVCGTPKHQSATIDTQVHRSRQNWRKMTVTEGSGRRAITHYHVLESFDRFSLVDLTLDTGRTHQIRLHLSHIGHPIVGDPVYGGGDKRALNDASSSLVRQSFLNLGRQALHARSLEFEHPLTRERVAYCSPLPTDIQSAIMTLSNPSDFA